MQPKGRAHLRRILGGVWDATGTTARLETTRGRVLKLPHLFVRAQLLPLCPLMVHAQRQTAAPRED